MYRTFSSKSRKNSRIMDPDDIDITDLIDDSDDNEDDLPDIENMTREQIINYVHTFGSLPLDDYGRMLILCSSYSGGQICGIYPIPDPNGNGSVMVCTGPLNTNNHSKGCAYNPRRLQK